MTITALTRTREASRPPADPALLLQEAARGDVEAFLAFYDLTSGPAYSLALGRGRLAGLTEPAARAAAEVDVVARFVTAYRRADEQASSGLSPVAWLLTLGVDAEAVPACA